MVIPRSQAREWDRLLGTINSLRRQGDPDAVALGNTLYTLFVVEEERFEPKELIETDRIWRALFRDGSGLEAA